MLWFYGIWPLKLAAFFSQAEQYHLKIIQLRQSSLGPDHLETLQAVAWPQKNEGGRTKAAAIFPMNWMMVWQKNLDLLSLDYLIRLIVLGWVLCLKNPVTQTTSVVAVTLQKPRCQTWLSCTRCLANWTRRGSLRFLEVCVHSEEPRCGGFVEGNKCRSVCPKSLRGRFCC